MCGWCCGGWSAGGGQPSLICRRDGEELPSLTCRPPPPPPWSEDEATTQQHPATCDNLQFRNISQKISMQNNKIHLFTAGEGTHLNELNETALNHLWFNAEMV